MSEALDLCLAAGIIELSQFFACAQVQIRVWVRLRKRHMASPWKLP